MCHVSLTHSMTMQHYHDMLYASVLHLVGAWVTPILNAVPPVLTGP